MELICPICGAALRREEKTWRCENRHSYDAARSGYVNLLPPSPKGKRHGDDKAMVAARTAFLSHGYYDPIIRAAAAMSAQVCAADSCVVDAGCGEGTYTKAVSDACAAAGRPVRIVGIDLSTDALRHAARLVPDGVFCAASTAHMPLADGCAQLLLNIFSPYMQAEFLRVLAPGGYLLRAVPMERHLWELKAAVYDRPYENPPIELPLDGFRLVREERIVTTAALTSNEGVKNLFLMTPYYYKTGAEDQKKLDHIAALPVTAAVSLALYQKI